jgi:outer membrane protein assembly factor BamB
MGIHPLWTIGFLLALSLAGREGNSQTAKPSVDCGRTRYFDYRGKDFATGWKYFNGPTHQVTASSSGPLFIQFLTKTVASISPSGKELWSKGTRGRHVLSFTNDALVYHESTDTLVLGWWNLPNCTIVAREGKSGKVLWEKVTQKSIFGNPITLLELEEAVNVIDADSYSDDTGSQFNSALKLKDGSVLWNTSFHSVHSAQESLLLCDGKTMLFCETTDPPSAKSYLSVMDTETGQLKWNTSTTYEVQKVASSDETLYVTAEGEQSDILLGIDPSTGSTLWRILSPCVWDKIRTHTSGATVDKRGNAYFSCGFLVYSVDRRGLVRWVSTRFENSSTPGSTTIPPSPSYHPSGYIYVIPFTQRAMVYVLSVRTGQIVHSYDLGYDEYFGKIFLMGNKFFYLIGSSMTAVRMEQLPEIDNDDSLII